MHQMQTTIKDGQPELMVILTCSHCLEQVTFEDAWYIWCTPDPLPKNPYHTPILHAHEKCINNMVFYRNISQPGMQWYGYKLSESLTSTGRQKNKVPTYTIDPAQCTPPKIPISSLNVSDVDNWLASFITTQQEWEFLNEEQQ